MMRIKLFFRLLVVPFFLLGLNTTIKAQACDDYLPPTGAATQTLIVTYTLADLEVEGDNLIWYSNAALTNEIPDTTEATNGTTYYVVQTNGVCTSDALAITVTLDYPAITVSTDQYSVNELVEDVLIDSPCAFVDNITWSTGTNFGGPNGIGYFENTNPLFPMERGIILSSGNVNSAPGPKQGAFGTQHAGATGWVDDAELQNYMNGIVPPSTYHNATIIEFEFQANSDEMSFNFLFASEKYGTHQCNFSDAFAFFLTNTQTGITTNLALVPGTNDPISVTTIRDGQWNGGFNGVCGDGNPPSMNEEYFGVFNAENAMTQSQAAINFQGQTVKMTAISEVEPNVTYHIKLVIADRGDQSFDSAIFIEGGSFDIGAPDLGGDKLIVDDSALCSGEPYVLDTQLSADEYVFHWFRDGIAIPGENGPSLEVTESGTYSVDIVPIGVGCNENPEPVVIEIYNPVVENFPPLNLRECRAAGDTTLFNLVYAMEGVNNNPNVEATYYLSEANAENEENAIADPYQYELDNETNQPVTIWVRLQSLENPCYKITNFNIGFKSCDFELNPLQDIVVCSEEETAEFDFSSYTDLVYNANLGYTVTYYESEEDAEDAVNAIPSADISAYEAADGTIIWVRVQDNNNADYYQLTSFTLRIHPAPVINPSQQSIYGCEVPGTGGSGEFDLSLNIGNITMNTPYLNVEYYLTEAQAELGDSSLSLPTLYVGPSGIIYGRIINTQTGCYTVAPQELIVRATPTANELAPIVHCNANNDGFGTFNLAALVHEIAGNPVPTGIDVTFHHTLSDAQNFANEIENPSNYTNAQSGGETLYVRVGYEYSSCSAIVPLELIVQSTPAVQTPSALEMCDVDNNGLEIFDLTSKESEILNGLTPSDYTITYHTTQANAHSGSSAIGNPSSFSNTVSIVYVRVEDNSSGCYRVVSMLLRLLPTPEVDQPIADYVLCDDEVNDGFTSFDLTSRIPMITDGVQGLIVTFHYTQSDAASGSNPLPNNYQNVVANVQTIHVRVARADTGCYTLTTMNLVVNAGPVINVPEEPYVECSSNQGGGSLSIDLTYYGAMLTVGTDYSIMGYYETESNAINQTSPILAPTAYDGLANNQITVWLRIADEATGCWSVVSIDIILEVRPFIPSNIPSLTLCDETGNRQDGSTIFDLTLQTPYLLDAQPQAGDYVVSYYTSEVAANAGAPAIGNPEQYTNTVNGQVVWFRIERTDSVGGCYAVGSFTLEVDTPMELNIAPNLSLCDASLPNDGTAVFDLTVNEGIILGGEVFGAEVKYHNSQAQAQVAGVSIANPENYNTNGVSSQVIWVSVTNEEGCISVTSFTIRVLPLPEPNLSPLPLEACEDVEFGGEGYFMLGDKDTEIANNDTSLLIQYYYSEADALAGVEGTEIPKDEPFYTGTTIVYVRVSTQPHIESETCFVVLELQLIVHEKPSIPEISTYLICMQHATGFHQFDLLEKNAEVLGNRPSTDYTVKYYGSLADAEADFNPLAYQYTNTVAWLQTIWVRLEDNATGCYNVSSLDLRIEERVFAHMPESLEYCDIDGVNDGLTTVDLTLLDDEIKLIQLVPNAQLGVNYYASESDYANGIAIADPSNYTTVSYPQTIIAEVYQLIDWGEGAEPGMCRDTVTFEIEVIDAPEMNDIEDGIICFEYNREGGNIPTSYLMDTGLSESDHTFVWRRNGQVINGATSSYYEATQGGTYVVVVTSNATGCSASQTIVLEEAPAITIDIVHITDGFSDTNGIEVIVSPNAHTYEYALDEGAYQLSNIFLDVSPGEHTVWVRVVGSDTGAACPASKTVVILNYPKFFTPNGDGYNDTWNIWSLQSQPESKIYIFDRHGKLLKQISPNGEGWDGTFNGRDLPSTDYWFRVEYIEPNTRLNKEFRGHFSLKR